MENVLPAEILLKIFLYLNLDDVKSISDTCEYWKYIVENFNIWKCHWSKLLKHAKDSSLEQNTYIFIKQFKISSPSSQRDACIRLKNILVCDNNKIRTCFSRDFLKYCEYAVLKTHHSHVMLTLFKNYKTRNGIMSRYLNKECYPTSVNNKLTTFENIKKIFDNNTNDHLHVKILAYCYPMAIHPDITNGLIKFFFEVLHVEDIIFIPRVIVLCENLNLEDAIVIYSTSKSTEITVILNGVVPKNRWCTLPTGGLQVAQHLQTAYTWLHPNALESSVQRFEDSTIKSRCWLTTSATVCAMKKNMRYDKSEIRFKSEEDKNLIFESEQFLAPELMYIQLDLPTVIKKLLNGLPEDVISNCLNHVILSGGNSKIKFFKTRLTLDLNDTFPEYIHVIHVSVHTDCTLGYLPKKEIFDVEKSSNFNVGTPSRIAREQYIIHGV